jgi:hypothetical protein
LDEARTVADAAATTITQGQIEPILVQFFSFPEAKGREAELRAGLWRELNQHGPILACEYRNQAILMEGEHPDMSDLEQATSSTMYAVRTKTRRDGEVILTIETVLVDGQHRVVSLNVLDYAGNVPPWLKPGVSRSDPHHG